VHRDGREAASDALEAIQLAIAVEDIVAALAEQNADVPD
jgi:hypothetical protein